jgi:multidrug efflux pump subunit AcrA (membrane-fusion protein)
MNLSLIEPDESPEPRFWGDRGGLRNRPGDPRPPDRPRERDDRSRPWWSALASGISWPASRGSEWLRRHVTPRQQAAGLLVVAACLGVVAWYVAGIAAADGRSFPGTVTSSGVVDLNFAKAGQVATISVRAGQNVKAGQVLATEDAAAAAVTADQAAIQADQASLAELDSEQEGVTLATAQAKLAKDKAQLIADQAAVGGMRIVAPTAGTVIAVNGQEGQTVTAQGSPISVTSAASVPVIMLRTSTNWQVEMVVPASSAGTVPVGSAVTVAVPAAHLSGVRGRVEGLLPAPVRIAQGVGYQALVTVIDHQPDPPLAGMAADVRPAS